MRGNKYIKKTVVTFTMICFMIVGMLGGIAGETVYADTTVYVTKTGSKYHKKKCGNGNFYQSTLSAAKARGLTPCEKCYGSGYSSDSDSSDDSDSEADTTQNSTAKKTIKISNKSITLVVGKSKKLKVNGTKSKVSWSSSEKKVADVSSQGKVTAKKKGNAIITASVDGKKLTCKVKVEAPKLSSDNLVLIVDEEAEIELKGCSHDVEWISNNPDVAEVDDGTIYAYDVGKAIIKAKVHGKTYKCIVTVENAPDSSVE